MLVLCRQLAHDGERRHRRLAARRVGGARLRVDDRVVAFDRHRHLGEPLQRRVELGGAHRPHRHEGLAVLIRRLADAILPRRNVGVGAVGAAGDAVAVRGGFGERERGDALGARALVVGRVGRGDVDVRPLDDVRPPLVRRRVRRGVRRRDVAGRARLLVVDRLGLRCDLFGSEVRRRRRRQLAV